jgi:hypothetical protein
VQSSVRCCWEASPDPGDRSALASCRPEKITHTQNKNKNKLLSETDKKKEQDEKEIDLMAQKTYNL